MEYVWGVPAELRPDPSQEVPTAPNLPSAQLPGAEGPAWGFPTAEAL